MAKSKSKTAKATAKKGAKAKPAQKAKAAVKKAKASPKKQAKAKPVVKKAASKVKAVVKKVVSKPKPKPKAVAKSKAVVKPKAKPVIKKSPVSKQVKAKDKKALKVAPIAKVAAKVTGKAMAKPSAKENKAALKAVKSPEIQKEVKPSIEIMSKNELPKLSTIQTTHSFTKQKAQPLPSTVKELNPDGTEKSRYSDKELKEFKELIVEKIENAKAEFALLQQQLNNANENGTDDTGGTFKMLEDGSETLAKEEAAQLAARQRKFIEQLESALVRIENKSYGICRVTGKLIPKERLKAVPHTTQSIEAKLMQYKDQ